MKKEELGKTIKAVKIRAVAQFATARNNEAHDKQWALSKVPSSLINCGADVDPGGVFRVSSDGDDRMGAKIKTQKNP